MKAVDVLSVTRSAHILVLSVIATLAFTSSLPAQHSADGARERSRLLSDPEAAATYILDVIRQGIQTGHVERTFEVLDASYVDEEPGQGTRKGRTELIVHLRKAIERSQNRPRPEGYEYLTGLYKFGWTDIEIQVEQGPNGATQATVRADGSIPEMRRKVQVTFHMQRSVNGWRIVNSNRFANLIAALEAPAS